MKKGFVIKNKTKNQYVWFGEMDAAQIEEIEMATFFFKMKKEKREWVEQAKENSDADDNDEFEAVDVEVSVKIIK